MFHKSSLRSPSSPPNNTNKGRVILMASGNKGLVPQPSSTSSRTSPLKQSSKWVPFDNLWSRSSSSSGAPCTSPALTDCSASSYEEILNKAPGRVAKYTSHKSWRKLSLVLNKLIDIKATRGHLPHDLLSGSFFFKHENALHLACRNASPLYILQKLVFISPELPLQVDELQRTPLHHFCAMHYSHDYYCYYSCGNSIEDVLHYLIEISKDAAEAKDVDGRTALHLSCAGNVRGYGGSLLDAEVRMSVSSLDTKTARQDIASILKSRKAAPEFHSTKNTIHPFIIKALCQANPLAVNEEDVYGMTPIEYAVDTCVEYEVLASMWKVSGLQWKRVCQMGKEAAVSCAATGSSRRRGSVHPTAMVPRTA